MFTINSKPIFNTFNIINIARQIKGDTTREIINKWCDIVEDFLYIRRSLYFKRTTKTDRNAKFMTYEQWFNHRSTVPCNIKNLVFKDDKIVIEEKSTYSYKHIFAVNPRGKLDEPIDPILTKKYDPKHKGPQLTEEEIKMRRDWDINLNDLDRSWDISIFLELLPKFKVNYNDVSIRFINLLLALHAEIIKANSRRFGEATGDSITIATKEVEWDHYDNMVKDILSFCDFDKDGYLIDKYGELENSNLSKSQHDALKKRCDNAYNIITTILSGTVTYYVKSGVLNIYLPMLHKDINTDMELLEKIYELFNEDLPKYRNSIILLVNNYIKDYFAFPIKLNLPGRVPIFGEIEGDNIIEFTYKLCEHIATRSEVKSKSNQVYYLVIYQLSLLLKFAKRYYNIYFIDHDRQIEKYNEMNEDYPVEFKLLSKLQSNILNSVCMFILSELYYSNRIKITGLADKVVIDSYDELIEEAVKSIDISTLIGLNNPEFLSFAKYFRLIEHNEEVSPMVFKFFTPAFGLKCNCNTLEFNDKVERIKIKLHDYCIDKWYKINGIIKGENEY